MSLPKESSSYQISSIATFTPLIDTNLYFEIGEEVSILVIDPSSKPTIVPTELSSIAPLPTSLQNFTCNTIDEESLNLKDPTVVILPTEGGGRGPIVSSDGAITTESLLYSLKGAIDTTQFTDSLNNILNTTVIQTNENTSDIQSLINYTNGVPDQVNQNTSAISSVESQVNQNSNNLSNLDNDVQRNTFDITNLSDTVSNQQNQIDTNTNEIANLYGSTGGYDGRITTNTNDINSLDTAFISLSTSVNTNTDRLDSVENKDIDQDNALTDLYSQIENINNNLGLSADPYIKDQQGLCTNADTVLLDFEWLEDEPKLTVKYSQGITCDPTNVNPQEIICGHSGLVPGINANTLEFTAYAALLEKSAPVESLLDWTPPPIASGYPAGTSTTGEESTEETTSAACMGLRVQGFVGLSNSIDLGTEGKVYVEMQVDGGDWFIIDTFKVLFKDATGAWITRNFDKLFVFDQIVHTYKFRYHILSKVMPETSSIINGALHIDKITEIGFGTVISNDIYMDWIVEE